MNDAQDMVSVLVHDHEEVKDMFQQIENAADGETRRTVADQVTAELVRHSVVEEMYLYPAAREQLSNGDQMADQEIEEHAEAEQLLKRWEKLDGDDPEFLTVFREVRQSVLEHIEEEEGQLFPAMQSSMSRDEMIEVGQKMQKAKALAPTRPHPSSPDKPPLNKLLGPGVGIVDRVRDKMSGRQTG
jgi:hemerythrin-like domain-containing protein